ncbi:hypothetical protein Nepgr_025672 [Nepenthes gracilis]|uniref:Uncharacterized protein n=1 Tax=Nepenthes gracilis TaxID=150966 RepID=A0AAD3T6V5_NEPGR|nr:hypothetical protein Nepgr_025672 [Nepenthes gracilis]
MEAVETQRLTSQSSISQELPKPPGHATLGGAYKYQNKKGRIGCGYGCCKLITSTVSMIIFLFFAAGVITVWVAFRRAGMPQFMVQRLAIPKFDVHSDLKGYNAVLSTDMEFFLVADNKKNGIIGTSCGSMVMEVNWDEHKGHLVEEKVPFFTQNTGSSTVLKIQTHGEAKILNKHLEKDEMKLDLVLSGDVVFFWGPLKSKGYPFIVSCTDISTAASDSLCDAKLYSSSPHPRYVERTKLANLF